jgi:aminoglycoside/choline kinase family phosphotransferase
MAVDRMNARTQAAAAFVRAAGWADATIEPLSGDASFRRYFRVAAGPHQGILMDAPPDREDVGPFLQIGATLRAFGFAAPEVLASDAAQGFLLLEDLGDDLFNVVLRAGEDERPLYDAAVDVLRDLHRRDVPEGVPVFDAARILREVSLFVEWALPALLGEAPSSQTTDTFEELWQDAMAPLLVARPVLCLFDYHAENLIWLPQRQGLKRVGLLDFQDAVAGPPAYDLVSLLEDARRDVSPSVVAHELARYLDDMPRDQHDLFRASYAVAGAQRNTRILGVFGRLFLRDNKPGYLSLMPRVWRHLENDLQSPNLKGLRAWFDAQVPEELRRFAPDPQTFVAP